MNKKLQAWWKANVVDDAPLEVTRARPKLSDMSFKVLIESVKRGVTREELWRAERG